MEAFPSVSAAHLVGQTSNAEIDSDKTRPRRGSNLGGDPRGDTGVGSLATRTNQSNGLATGEHSKAEKSGKHPSRRRRARGLLSRWKRMSVRHTWVNPLILVLLIITGYSISPGDHNPLRPAIFLSYANPPAVERTSTLPPEIGNPTQYGKGPRDFAFVAFYTVFFTFTREFLMQRVIRPIAVWFGIKSAKQARFMEQFYTAIYFGVFGPFGLFVMSRTQVWYFRTAGMYEGFPHRAHEAYFKAYYLLQASYWAQQAIVLMLQLEKPRKDFKELVLHHIVTLSLIYLSYRFHFTYMGVAVYITHDISDFFLATVKVLNYIDSPIVPAYYIMFLGIWAYLRHYINLSILYSMLPGGEFENVGRYDLSWPEQQYKCLLSQVITFGLLSILQAVNVFWFALICRIMYRYASRSQDMKDERSDDEDGGEYEMTGEQSQETANGGASKPVVMVNGEPISPVDAPVPLRSWDNSRHRNTAKRRR